VSSVTLLTNFVPPYLVSLFAALQARVGRLSLVVSTPMEGNRPWAFQGEGLPVRVQRTLTLRRRWRHPGGFSEALYLHVPLDTLPILWRERPDVIVTTEFGARTLQAVLYRALQPRTRIVLWAPVSEASERGRGGVRRGLRRWLLRRVDAVIVSGQSGARYVAGLGFPEAAIFCMPPYAATLPAREPSAQLQERASRRLLYVGQLVARKGLGPFLDDLARHATASPAEDLELWIVGDGPERAALEARPMPENVALRFCGNVAYDELPATYRRAGILVFPTLADEWGVVVNEAMAAGVPVLGSLHSQAVEDLVQEGRTGWTFRPDREGEAQAALARALATPADELEEMRARCLAQARRFAPELAVLRMLEAIEFAATRSPRLPEAA
jgi:glycosyltransferase involved in cell wall biosynthesis